MNRLFWFVWVGLFPMKLDDLPRQARDRHGREGGKAQTKRRFAQGSHRSANWQLVQSLAPQALALLVSLDASGRMKLDAEMDRPWVVRLPSVCILLSSIIHLPDTLVALRYSFGAEVCCASCLCVDAVCCFLLRARACLYRGRSGGPHVIVVRRMGRGARGPRIPKPAPPPRSSSRCWHTFLAFEDRRRCRRHRCWWWWLS